MAKAAEIRVALRDARAALDTTAEEIAAARAEVDAADALEASAALGEVDAAAVAERRAAADARLHAAEQEASRVGAVVAGLEPRLEAALQDDRLANLRRLEARLPELDAAVVHDAANLRGIVAAGAKQAGKLVVLRRTLDSLYEQALAAAADAGVELDFTRSAEADFLAEGWEQLVEVLQGAPSPDQLFYVGSFEYVGGGPRKPSQSSTADADRARDRASVQTVAHQLASMATSSFDEALAVGAYLLESLRDDELRAEAIEEARRLRAMHEANATGREVMLRERAVAELADAPGTFGEIAVS